MDRVERTLDDALIHKGSHVQGRALVELAQWIEKQNSHEIAGRVQRQLGRVLKFFVNHQISPIIRRWAGYYVFMALRLKGVNIDNKTINSNARRLGSIITDAQEDLRIIAFMIMRALHSKGLSIPHMCSQGLQPDVSLIPESLMATESPEWVKSYQDQLDVLHRQGIVQSSSQVDYLYDVLFDGEEYMTEGRCLVLAIFDETTITLLAPPTHKTPFVFVDIPLDSIGDLQRQKTDMELSANSFVKEELKIYLHTGCTYNAKATDIESMSWIFHTKEEADRITTIVRHKIAQNESHTRSSATQPLQVGNATGATNGKTPPKVSTPQKRHVSIEDQGTTEKSSKKSRKRSKQTTPKPTASGNTPTSAINQLPPRRDAHSEAPVSSNPKHASSHQKQRHRFQSEDDPRADLVASNEKTGVNSQTQLDRSKQLPRLHGSQKRKSMAIDSVAQNDLSVFDIPESPEVEKKKAKKSHDSARSKPSRKKEAGTSRQSDAQILKNVDVRSTDAKPTPKPPVKIKREPGTTPPPKPWSSSQKPGSEKLREVGKSQEIPIEISSNEESMSDASSDPGDETYQPTPKKPSHSNQRARGTSTPILKPRSQQPKERKPLRSALKQQKTPAIDEAAERKPTVISFNEKGPRNQGSSTTKQTPQLPPSSLMPTPALPASKMDASPSKNRRGATPFVGGTPFPSHQPQHQQKDLAGESRTAMELFHSRPKAKLIPQSPLKQSLEIDALIDGSGDRTLAHNHKSIDSPKKIPQYPIEDEPEFEEDNFQHHSGGESPGELHTNSVEHATQNRQKKRRHEEASASDSPRPKRHKSTEPRAGDTLQAIPSHQRHSWRDQHRPISQPRRESVRVTGDGSPVIMKTGSAAKENGNHASFLDKLQRDVMDSPASSSTDDDDDDEPYEEQFERPFDHPRLSSNRKALPVSPHMESQAISGFATEADIERLSSDHPEASPFTGVNTDSAPRETPFLVDLRSKMKPPAAHVHPTPKTEGRRRKQQQQDFQPTRQPEAVVPMRANKSVIEVDSSDTDSILGRTGEEEQARHEYDREWEDSLAPHQKHILDILFRCSRSIVRRLSNTEAAIDDMVDEYIEDGRKLIQELEEMHHGDYQNQLGRFQRVAEKLTTSLGNIKEKAASRQREVSNTLDESRRKRREKAYLQQVQTVEGLIP